MAHKSENCVRLQKETRKIRSITELTNDKTAPKVFLLWFPSSRKDEDAEISENTFSKIESFCEQTHDESTICILTSPSDAARLLPFLEKSVRFQLWIAVKEKNAERNNVLGQLPQKHSALLVMTRYKKSLRHTTTRIAYTYCPACGKTTKDYGGKKHIYNSYGTLLSDVWRDFEIDSAENIDLVEDRLQDMFGLSPYKTLEILDMRKCFELAPSQNFGSLNDKTPYLFSTKRAKPPESRLINGDCLEVLASIPNESVDFCFADPPYNIQKKYDHWNDALEMKDYFEWCDKWLSQLARVLKPGRTLAVINIPLWAVRHYQHLCKTLKFQNWIAWDALSLPVRMIMPSHYAIICFSKGNPRPLPGLESLFLSSSEGNNFLPTKEFFCIRSSCVTGRNKIKNTDRTDFTDLWYDIHRLKHNSKRVDHPCQLPPALMRRLFALFTKPDEMILDCFDGAGTSTLIAHQMNRRFIGIELSLQYHKLAQERHDMILRDENPFEKRSEVPQAKNSRVERLPKQKYAVSKKVLQLEVRHIAQILGKLPSREDVKATSKYPIEYFDSYFVSWGEVCAAARHDGMSELPHEAIAETQQAKFF